VPVPTNAPSGTATIVVNVVDLAGNTGTGSAPLTIQ
jgi:hypothetical protein